MLYEYRLETPKEGLIDITEQVRDACRQSGVFDGMMTVYCPHTTAGVTINENTDPNVRNDLLFALNEAYPDRAEFRHAEGNSAAHLKASVIGSSVTIMIDDGEPVLGTWQAVYFAEFDGPRSRRFTVKVMGTRG
ncbi:MAG: YjbQ family protein [Clostridia bacterium]|nr:YjbQ family protein [Clostridia bacterium]